MVTAGTKNRNMNGTRSNRDLSDAVFSRKSDDAKNYPVKSRKTLITTYAMGLSKYECSSLFAKIHVSRIEIFLSSGWLRKWG